ncbi:MAG: hypothetical protein VX693_06970 [Pseudomonadota bacterium]|nr:hypothetical protein [Pseudomonadota bacterium]
MSIILLQPPKSISSYIERLQILITTVKKESQTQSILLECVCAKLVEQGNRISVHHLKSGFNFKHIVHSIVPVLLGIYYVLTNREKILGIKYSGFLIGKYAASAAYRSPRSYASAFIFFYNFAHALGRCVKLIDNCVLHRNEAVGFFPTEITYTNGVLIELAFKWKKRLFIQKYPHNFREINTLDERNKLDLFLVKSTKLPKKVHRGNELILNLLEDPNLRDYMKDISFTQLNKNIDDPYAVIYTHSFTDAQQDIGGEENYITMLDWLKHTLLLLRDKKVIVKAHPAFYANSEVGTISFWDRTIFLRFKKSYKNPNHTFVDYPMTNKSLLDKLSRNVILISHHGNALLEGGYLGFPCLSASASFWSGRNIFTEWSTREEYKHLLYNPNKIRVPKKYDIAEYLADFYLSETSCFNENSWQKIIASELKISFSDVFSGKLNSVRISKEARQRCIERIRRSL